MKAGTHLLAFGSMITWPDFVELIGKATGVKTEFVKAKVSDHAKLMPGGYGEEMGEMFAYAMDFGYWGGDPAVVYPKDVSLRLSDIL